MFLIGAQVFQSSTPLYCTELSKVAEELERQGRDSPDWEVIETLVEMLVKALSNLNAEVMRCSGQGSESATTRPDSERKESEGASSSAPASVPDPVRVAKSLPSIDWDAAMTAVGEDHEFLVDVLSDFVSAASAGMAALSAAMLGAFRSYYAIYAFVLFKFIVLRYSQGSAGDTGCGALH